MPHLKLHTTTMTTPIGDLVAIASEQALCLLEFSDSPHLVRKIDRMQRTASSPIVHGINAPLAQIARELEAYFAGERTEFHTPLHLDGTPFQIAVWETLRQIPYGTTRAYATLAKDMGRANAHRAAANANGRNNLVIVIPCHRIIRQNGELGGYSSGIAHKKWLLAHEARFHTTN